MGCRTLISDEETSRRASHAVRGNVNHALAVIQLNGSKLLRFVYFKCGDRGRESLLLKYRRKVVQTMV